MSALRAWARQPTTVAGFSAMLGTLCALLLHQVQWTQAVPLLVGAVTSMILPDNAGAKQEAEALATEAVSTMAGAK
jgi:CHASE2 domain-containing sensor protein